MGGWEGACVHTRACVSVHLGCLTKYPRLGGTNRCLSRSVEAESLRSGHQRGRVTVLLACTDGAFVSPRGGGCRELPGPSKGVHLVQEGSTVMT